MSHSPNAALHASRLGLYPGTYWTVLTYLGILSGKHPYYQCRCACGTERPVDWTRLVRGKTFSCGDAICTSKQAHVSKHTLTLGDKTQTLTAWANELGIKYATIYHRLRNGATHEQALGTRHYGALYITAFGKTMSVSAWACEVRMKYITLYKRLNRMPPEIALTKPVGPYTHYAKTT